MKKSTLVSASRTNSYFLDSIKYLQQSDFVQNNDVRLELIEQLTKIQLQAEETLKEGTNSVKVKQLAELEHTFERLTFLIENISKGVTVLEHYYLLIIILIISLPYHLIAKEEIVYDYEVKLKELTETLEGFCNSI